MRSHTTLKIKPMDDDEWPVIGWTQGSKGKDVGAIKWILTVTPETIKQHKQKHNPDIVYPSDPNDRTYDAVTKGLDYEQRYAAFQFLTANPDYFDKHLRDQPMSVQFSIISKFGKPQQPKVLGFRNPVVQKKWLECLSAKK